MAAQNVRYAEIIVAAGVVLWKNQDFAPIFEAIRAAAGESGVQVRWILDAVRQFGVEPAMRVAELAAERVDRGVVALGIGGSEERGPAGWFKDVFGFARNAGLHLHAHAGESMGPESIWDALELGAERIGHGIAAVRDERLMSHLRERDIPLEICITSNVVTGVVQRIEDHPVRRLFEAGVPIVLNSDDPAMFRCSLTGEYRLAAEQFGFTEAETPGDCGERLPLRLQVRRCAIRCSTSRCAPGRAGQTAAGASRRGRTAAWCRYTFSRRRAAGRRSTG